jgi:murein DD-endopeptidase / murein LD-carboxypeptidase
MTGGELIAARALGAVGTPFRLHGRRPGIALDCVGLVAHAVELPDVPVDYSLRGTYNKTVEAYLDLCNGKKLPSNATPRNGDLALVQCGPHQCHLMIRAHAGWVHAHAGLRRVVHMPGPSSWPIIALWRFCPEPDGD